MFRRLAFLVIVTALAAVSVSCGPRSAEPASTFAVTDLGKGGLVRLPGLVDLWVKARAGDPRAPAIRSRIAAHPAALWLAGNLDDDRRNLRDAVRLADDEDGTLQVVLYNLPGRNDGIAPPRDQLSASDYRAWIDLVSAELGTRRTILVIEPDALWFVDRQLGAEPNRWSERIDLIRYAIETFGRHNRTRMYVDAGTSSGSVTPRRMAQLLQLTGVGPDVGFAVNVSSFAPRPQITAYAESIQQQLATLEVAPRTPYLIDTSRNGNPHWDTTWCNPPDRRLGRPPAVIDQGGHDYDLWVKGPGDSDGPCGIAPHSQGGEFLPDVAFGMMRP